MKKQLLLLLMTFLASQFTFSQNFVKSTINANTGNNPYRLASGNLNGDAFLDIAICTDIGNTVEWYANNGDGTFAAGITLVDMAPNNLVNAEGITIADIDGDNDDDIFATGYTSDNLVWFENNGDGTFQDAVTISSSLDGAGTVLTANLDNDVNGYLDIVISEYDGNRISYMLGNGDGTFGAVRSMATLPASSNPGDFDIADFDADGDLDIVVANTGSGTVEVYDSRLVQDGVDGGGNIPFEIYDNSVDTGNGFLFDINFSDVDDDGSLDIVKSDYFGSPGIVWYSNDSAGTGTTWSSNPITISLLRTGVTAVADLNNDTYNDLIVTNGRATDDDVVWFISDNLGGLGSETVIDNTQQAIFDIEIQDFDNDGDLDFATVSNLEHDLNLFTSDLIPPLNTNSFEQETVSLYPNPTTSKLNFKGISDPILNVSVFDVLGKKVLDAQLNSNQSLDVSKLKSGVYMLQLKNRNTIFKFVKE